MAYVYMLICKDGSLYTGIARDIRRRLQEHQQRGAACARYTRAHPVQELAALWQAEDMRSAARLEYRIKELTRPEKLALLRQPEIMPALFPMLAAEKYIRLPGGTLAEPLPQQDDPDTE